MNNPFVEATPVAKKLKILFYGASGSGKTIAALSFPRVALIDAEGGADLYAGRPGIPKFFIKRAKTMTELREAVKFIREDNGKTFDTLVIDPITVFYEVQRDVLQTSAKTGEMGFSEWGKLNSRMKSVYNELTDLPVHVVVIAREATEYEGTGGNLRKVGDKPDADKNLSYLFDFVVKLNPDHTGTVKKSRGIDISKGDSIPKINWSIFEPVANAYTDGDTVNHQNDEEATRVEAEREAVIDFFKKWKAEGLTSEEICTALGIKKTSEWTQGWGEVADKKIEAWLKPASDSKPAAPKNGNGKHSEPADKPVDTSWSNSAAFWELLTKFELDRESALKKLGVEDWSKFKDEVAAANALRNAAWRETWPMVAYYVDIKPKSDNANQHILIFNTPNPVKLYSRKDLAQRAVKEGHSEADWSTVEKWEVGQRYLLPEPLRIYTKITDGNNLEIDRIESTVTIPF